MARFISHLVIHHSATPTGSVEEFRVIHKGRGFSDIGYHALIGNSKGTPDGHISQGRPEKYDGAGVYKNNRGKLHVCLVGNFEYGHSGYTGGPTKKQWSALGHWLLVKGRDYQQKDGVFPIVVGHKEITVPGHGTACPGNTFPLDLVRRWYGENINKFVHQKPVETLDVYIEHHRKG